VSGRGPARAQDSSPGSPLVSPATPWYSLTFRFSGPFEIISEKRLDKNLFWEYITTNSWEFHTNYEVKDQQRR
jgi:hypothetical protein